MISQDATHCQACGQQLRGRQRKFCSRSCKNKSYNGCYDFQQARGRSRKERLLQVFGGKCLLCGYDRCSSTLSFHHLDPSQKLFQLDLRNLSNRSWEVCLMEASKCTLLCLNCHAETHHLKSPALPL